MTTRKDAPEAKTLDLEQFKNHTPGPWQLTTTPIEMRNRDSAAAVFGPYKNGGSPLISDLSRSPGDTVAEANARLIAAAPQLLALCRELSAEVERLKAAQPQWIPVSERLPKVNMPVTGYFPDGDESGQKVAPAIMYEGYNRVQSSFPNSTAGWFLATHWMPLPEAPDRHLSPATDHSPKQS